MSDDFIKDAIEAADNSVDLGCAEFLKTALQQLAEARAEREWIPVSERLPESDVLVLAKHETGEIYHCRRTWNGREEVWAHAFVDAQISDDRFIKWILPPQEQGEQE